MDKSEPRQRPGRPQEVFVTWGTGYIGRPLIAALAARGHRVCALVRPGRVAALPGSCTAMVGDALDAACYSGGLAQADTLVHLVGVAHPSPARAAQFLNVDLMSVRAAVAAAQRAGVAHFVYVSVAQPAPVMHAYISARARGEVLLRESGIATTVLRPWYVLGPGHCWPHLLVPAYWIAERFARTRETARRLGLVSLEQMLAALVRAVEHPAAGMRVMDVPTIRQLA